MGKRKKWTSSKFRVPSNINYGKDGEEMRKRGGRDEEKRGKR
jgi:hypothetical protein